VNRAVPSHLEPCCCVHELVALRPPGGWYADREGVQLVSTSCSSPRVVSESAVSSRQDGVLFRDVSYSTRVNQLMLGRSPHPHPPLRLTSWDPINKRGPRRWDPGPWDKLDPGTPCQQPGTPYIYSQAALAAALWWLGRRGHCCREGGCGFWEAGRSLGADREGMSTRMGCSGMLFTPWVRGGKSFFLLMLGKTKPRLHCCQGCAGV